MNAPADLDIASILARTCEDQRAMLQRMHDELTRARTALATADCAQTTGEELGDAICRLAGERDGARAALHTIGRAFGIDQPDTEAGRQAILHRVLHVAARQPKPAALPRLILAPS
ncbi:MAG TPA: hypothetical protein VK178_07060 [Opitutaceae bacterium]|nr:hypothetical protein [Opitutaceae bacterium]